MASANPVLARRVRKTPSWPRSWANFSLSQLCSHRNAWASFRANLTPFSLKRYISRLNGSAVGRRVEGGRSLPAVQGAFINFPTSLYIEEDRVGDVELFRCHQASHGRICH